MSEPLKTIKYRFGLILFILFINTGCASLLKPEFNYKKKESHCSMEQLVGHDRYYYSDHYQRKLKKSTKRIARK